MWSLEVTRQIWEQNNIYTGSYLTNKMNDYTENIMEATEK